MKNLIKNSGYIFDYVRGVWKKSHYEGIAYNDGDEIEVRIANIIEQTSDITVLSTELRSQCTDWPSLYHLSGTRANVLRPFAGSLTGDVLEIGAGCGAITRYLGECGANVLALEGSLRRASIARSRTSDLENVTVLAEKFDEFQCNHKFDVITLIGVLEYANLFTTAENPALAMLQQVRSMLKPDGKLIIAIENQLGLKYFAGSPEDHVGKPMYGIEGRYKQNQPQTFGRKVLVNILEQAEFSVTEILTPFPDYKFPVSILTEKGILNQYFDAGTLAWQSARRDLQLPTFCNFSLELTWPEIFKNGMALDLANSYLLVASPRHQKFGESKNEILAFHYNTDRVSNYCKETRFELVDDKNIVVVSKMLGSENQPIVCKCFRKIIEFNCPEIDNYTNGSLLSWEFIQIVTMDGWTLEKVGKFINNYICLLEKSLIEDGCLVSLSSSKVRLPGKYFDYLPHNIIIKKNGTHVVIDKEWSFCEDLELGYLLFRCLLVMMCVITKFGENSVRRKFSRLEFIQSALAEVGFVLPEEEIYRFVQVESMVQAQVSGRGDCEFLRYWMSEQLPQYNLAQAFADRDKMVNCLKETVASINNSMESILCSRSWRLTAPLRSLFRQIKKIRKICRFF